MPKPNEVAAAFVYVVWVHVDVAREAVLHKTKFGRFESVPTQHKQNDEDDKASQATEGGTTVARRSRTRAVLAVFRILQNEGQES